MERGESHLNNLRFVHLYRPISAMTMHNDTFSAKLMTLAKFCFAVGSKELVHRGLEQSDAH